MDNKKPDKAYINELLDLLGYRIEETICLQNYPEVSSKEVSIGRALAYKPSIILADEPTGNLDSKNSREIIDLLKISVKRYNQTLMVITHDVDIASQADRIITIEDGIVSKDEVMALWKSYAEITYRYLKRQKKRTLLTVIGIILSVALITSIGTMVISARDMMIRNEIERTGDYHAIFQNTPNDKVNIVRNYVGVENSAFN